MDCLRCSPQRFFFMLFGKDCLCFAQFPLEYPYNFYFYTNYYIILKLFIVESPSLLRSKHPINNPWISYQFHFGYPLHGSLTIPVSTLRCFHSHSIFQSAKTDISVYVGRESNLTHKGAIIQSVDAQSFFKEYLCKRHKSFTLQSFLPIFIREIRLSFSLSSSHVEPAHPFALLAGLKWRNNEKKKRVAGRESSFTLGKTLD